MRNLFPFLSRRFSLSAHAGVALLVLAVIAGIATYAVLTADPSLGGNPQTLTWLLVADLLILLSLGAVVVRRIMLVWLQRRRGLAGARLHVRLVTIFGLLAVTPAILVAIFSVLFFYFGVQTWFSERVKTAINEAQNVAQAYLQEHKQLLRLDALAMATDLNREALRLSYDPNQFEKVVKAQAALREFNEVLVFDSKGKVWARAGYTFSLELDPVPETLLNHARRGEIVLSVDPDDSRVRALVRLEGLGDVFLVVGRFVDPQVLNYIKAASDAAQSYSALESQRSSLQWAVTSIYAVVALLLLLVAVWAGLNFANRLVQPVSRLIAATERVRKGDLTIRVEETGTGDELDSLSRAFNRMTGQLQNQQGALVEANRQLDIRRRFTEAVLEGVSAGVIGLDKEGLINLANMSAVTLLGALDVKNLIGRPLTGLAPKMIELLSMVQRHPGRLTEGQIQIKAGPGQTRTLLVRLVADQAEGEVRGYIVTFDDLSELVSAQRKAAWADVARRIAHEIKNPLTPIQLSAERLQRKYLKEVTGDPSIFQQCIDTIVRQVDDIRRMVDEFSAFARMPQAVMRQEDVVELCKQAIFLQSTANPSIEFKTSFPPHPVTWICDGRQLSQALTNLLQNAVDAIEGRQPAEDKKLPPGKIILSLTETPEELKISISDNGKGLPQDLRDRLTEPYVTTRAKGTGLGLAIVKKIMEEHGGVLRLEDQAQGGGTVVSLFFPRVLKTKGENII